jgi:integrase
VVDAESLDGRRLARRAAQALIEVVDENARREQGIYWGTGLIDLTERRHGNPQAASSALDLPVGTFVPLPAPAACRNSRTGIPGLSLGSVPPAVEPRDAPALAGRPDGSPSTQQPTTAPVSAAAREPVAPVVPPARGNRVEPVVRSASPALLPKPEDTGDSSIFAARVAAQFDAERARNATLGIKPAAQRMHMGRAFDAYIADMIAEKGKSWAVNSAPNMRSTKVLFIEINGDFWTDKADELHFALMRNLLRAVPKDHHKSPAQKPILEEIAELDEVEAVELRQRDAELRAAGVDRGARETELGERRRKRLRVSSVYRHQQDLQRFARWGVERGLFPRNFMQGLMWSKATIKALQREESDNRRLAWGDKAKALFGSRVFVEPLEDRGDPLFWAPLIARLGGLREEEVLQLKTPDFDTVDGTPVFRIQQGEGQVLKSEAARRIVPLHRALIALGLLELVEQRRREGQEWLFPKIERSASRDRLTGTFTKTFTRYRIEIGVYDPNRDFHSLRQDFNVSLDNADVPLFVRKRLLGHEINDVTEVNYNAAGKSVAQLADYVNRIVFDISGIRSPFASGMRTAERPRLALVKG